jgi:hypothetical protein
LSCYFAWIRISPAPFGSRRGPADEESRISTNRLLETEISKQDQSIVPSRISRCRGWHGGARPKKFSTNKLLETEILKQDQLIARWYLGQDRLPGNAGPGVSR